MATKVKISKSQLDAFRALVRGSKVEVLAYLVGSVESPTVVKVDYIAYTDRYAVQTTLNVSWPATEYHEAKQKAEDAVMSPMDHSGCITAGFRVSGIVSVYDRKTRVRFWTPDSALPCDVEYVKTSKSPKV
jgi:fructose-1,6-bisphosphatase